MIEQLLSEFNGIDLGDKRRNRRSEAVLSRLQAAPTLSFPRIFPIEAELEAFYRFVENPYIDEKAIIAPHIKATLERTKGLDTVLVIHDSTKFVFSGEREGLFTSKKELNGSFWGHCSLAVEGLTGRPLGVLRMHTWVREALTRTGAEKAGLPKKQIRNLPSEYGRWWESIRHVSDLSKPVSEAIHVCDSEADCYDLLASLSQNNLRFVIRGCQDRKIKEQVYARLRAKLADSTVIAKRTVPISRRAKAMSSTAKRNKTREEREVTLGVSCEQVTLLAPRTASQGAPKQLKINVVLVKEIGTPADCETVEWILLTSETIETEIDALRVIDIYRNRWIIEEYFKALKTGCLFEQRQLESYSTLQKCLALFMPLAWLMLHMRTVSRQNPSEPAEQVLPPIFLQVLRLHTRSQIETAQQALWATAGMGGHIKNNGPPGWLTLQRGLQELAMMVNGFVLALQMNTHTDVNKKM